VGEASNHAILGYQLHSKFPDLVERWLQSAHELDVIDPDTNNEALQMRPDRGKEWFLDPLFERRG